MKYRSKLYISFISVSAISAIFAISIDLVKTRSYLFKEVQSKVVSISATTAAQVDGEILKQIKTLDDEKKPAYEQMRNVLRKARDANRRSDIYIKYLYTIYPSPEDPHKFLFSVDPEESAKDVSHAGTEDPGATPDLLYDHLNEAYSFGKFVKDPWGVWMTGYAPVYDDKGFYVATVGTDMGADLVNAELNQLYVFAAVAFIFSILISMVVATILARIVTESLAVLQEATKEIGTGDFSYRVHLQTHDEFEDLADSMNKMNEGLEEKERLKTGFAHYVSQHVLEQIVKSKGGAKLEGERRKITVFFSDIRDFTLLAETLPAEEVVKLLNVYFKTMLDIIFKHNGLLDKLIGDGIMAEFGTPLDDPEQERNAVLTAIEMQEALVELREKWKQEGKPLIHIGIGIHTGEAVVGSIGSEKRMDYTAVGDTVNVASRLEHLTKEKECQIIISETTYNALKGEFQAKSLGSITLPGRKSPINVYAILLPKTVH